MVTGPLVAAAGAAVVGGPGRGKYQGSIIDCGTASRDILVRRRLQEGGPGDDDLVGYDYLLCQSRERIILRKRSAELVLHSHVECRARNRLGTRPAEMPGGIAHRSLHSAHQGIGVPQWDVAHGDREFAMTVQHLMSALDSVRVGCLPFSVEARHRPTLGPAVGAALR